MPLNFADLTPMQIAVHIAGQPYREDRARLLNRLRSEERRKAVEEILVRIFERRNQQARTKGEREAQQRRAKGQQRQWESRHASRVPT
jgi:hypothetical protein